MEHIVLDERLWWMKKESSLAKMLSTAGEKAAYDFRPKEHQTIKNTF